MKFNLMSFLRNLIMTTKQNILAAIAALKASEAAKIAALTAQVTDLQAQLAALPAPVAADSLVLTASEQDEILAALQPTP